MSNQKNLAENEIKEIENKMLSSADAVREFLIKEFDKIIKGEVEE